MNKIYIKLLNDMAEDLGLTANIEHNNIWFETYTEQGEDFIININSENVEDLKSELYDLWYSFDECEDAELMGQCRGAPDLRHRLASSTEKKKIYKDMYNFVINYIAIE